ncbi:MAG: ComEC/Rec2 family competence protein, partial [Bacteroidota bacterium]
MYQNKGRLFLKLLIPLASGMLAAYWSGLFLPKWYLIPTVLVIGAIYFLVHRKYLYTIRYSWFYGLSVTVFLFVVGFSFFSSDYDLHHTDHFINFKKDDFLILKINEPPVFKEKFVRCVVQAEKAGSKNQFHTCSGNAVAYFSNTDESLKFHYGDLVVVKNKPSALDAPNIPYQYDYKGYLDKKNIHFSIFLREKEFVPLNENDGYTLLRIAYSLRDWCVNCIKKYVASPKEAAVVSALTVGYRDEVTQDIVQSFSSAGVIHILAVSGMHVGLLYAMLLIILNFLFGKTNAKILKLIVLLSAIWLFAMVTGLSGSIVRASTMISAVIISKSINRRIDIINALCVSAFVLLLITPFIFIDAGFQLSFTALVGIALWERNFAQMIEFRNPLLHLVWRMCSVSMAAQLGVLPLTLFYFNQFPLLFLVANIIGVPLSTGILFGGLALFVLSLVPPVAVYAGMILKWSTQLLDNYINWVQSFSFSTLNIPSFGIVSLILTAIVLYFFY